MRPTGAKYSPAPWIVSKKSKLTGAVVAEDGEVVCDPTGAGRYEDEAEANARLIKCAPELFELLVEMMHEGCIEATYADRMREMVGKVLQEESDIKMDDVGYSLLRKEMPINPWLYEEVRREDGSLMTARIYTRGDARECFICEDETMLPQMMRDFWTSVGRRNIKCE